MGNILSFTSQQEKQKTKIKAKKYNIFNPKSIVHIIYSYLISR